MDAGQEKHLREIKADFNRLVDVKYRRGAEEHGGALRNMTEEQLVRSALDEAIDQVTYLMTLLEKLA